ncbi:MAG: dihydrolipoamide acetyltransferase [Proteobacteria bacterium]|nr:dihydrolipoamide acetyltransferase [Pseudomonadota bacterium]
MRKRVLIGLSGFAGLSLLLLVGRAQGAGAAPAAAPVTATSSEGANAATSAASSAASSAAVAPAPAALDAATPGSNTIRLRTLEQRVNELKERVFRSKARLNLLKETVLHGMIAGSRAIITHSNEMGGAFRLTKLVYGLDGKQIYSRVAEDGELDAKRSFEIFNGSIAPGNHTLSVTMVYRGHGYGVFTYLEGYRYNVRASHTFTTSEGRQNVITVRGFEKGNATTELTDRPAIAFKTALFSVTAKGAAQ